MMSDENLELDNSFSNMSVPTSHIYSSIFSGVLLSYWDNIMGPRNQRLWLGNDKIKITPDIVSFVSSHTLNGELCRVREEGQTDTKFYVLSDRGYIFFASIFLGMAKAGQTIHSLTFIMALEDLDRYLELQKFLNKQIEILVMKFRVLQEKDISTCVNDFSNHLRRLANATEQIEENKLPSQQISVSCTIFGDKDKAAACKLNDSKFLMRAITSHLQTCGSTLVIGMRRDAVNFVVNTLALFLTSSERSCSRYASGSGECSFERDLFLQGLVRKSSDHTVNSKDVLLSGFPTTYIDVDRKEVLQTNELKMHLSTRIEFLKLELNQLLKGEEAPVFPTRGLFNSCEDIAIMVQNFVSEIQLLPDLNSVKERYIIDFLCLLNQKATALISYIHAKSLRGVDAFSQEDIRRMRHDLSLLSEADFQIVLAQAEKNRPGIVPFLFQKVSKYEAANQGADMTPFFL